MTDSFKEEMNELKQQIAEPETIEEESTNSKGSGKIYESLKEDILSALINELDIEKLSTAISKNIEKTISLDDIKKSTKETISAAVEEFSTIDKKVKESAIINLSRTVSVLIAVIPLSIVATYFIGSYLPFWKIFSNYALITTACLCFAIGVFAGVIITYKNTGNGDPV